MRVSEALVARRSVRGFTNHPVDVAQVERLLLAASRAPSGGNLQPWHVDVMTGQPLAAFKMLMAGKLMAGEVETPEYPIYPTELDMPYKDRRFAVGEAMYGHIGIPRDDKAARRQWFARNFAFFGAPVALFVSIDRRMGPPQWSDLGMFLQSLMLLAVEDGLATCAQECWAMYPQTVGAAIGMPAGRMLFCGMALGHEDLTEPANQLRSERAGPPEWLRLHG
ncbi:NADH dehydrogenase [Sphingomonas antarctica]|uniref:nitroreductase n=1 Tax=Sphingomonas antarctica TaxID=2040274 RepID=UPI0039E8886B